MNHMDNKLSTHSLSDIITNKGAEISIPVITVVDIHHRRITVNRLHNEAVGILGS